MRGEAAGRLTPDSAISATVEELIWVAPDGSKHVVDVRPAQFLPAPCTRAAALRFAAAEAARDEPIVRAYAARWAAGRRRVIEVLRPEVLGGPPAPRGKRRPAPESHGSGRD